MPVESFLRRDRRVLKTARLSRGVSGVALGVALGVVTGSRSRAASLIAQIALIALVTLVGTHWAAPAWGQSGAELAPSDTGLFIEVNDLKSLRERSESDPFAQMLRELTPERQRREWATLAALLGMTTQGVVDRYFGTSVVVVAPAPRDGSPGVLALKLTPEDAAFERLAMAFAVSASVVCT